MRWIFFADIPDRSICRMLESENKEVFEMEQNLAGGKGRCGALYIEATLSLSFFMFAMFTLLSVIQISYTQARMAAALDSAAKEIAEYTHIYYATGMAETFGGSDGASSNLFNDVADFLEGLGGNVGAVSEDLGQFLTGIGAAVRGDSLSQWLQSAAGKGLTKKLLEKNMVSRAGDTAQAFQKRNHITSMNLDGSKFLEDGGSDVFMRVNYDIQVIRLLQLDITLHMSHCAYARAWK